MDTINRWMIRLSNLLIVGVIAVLTWEVVKRGVFNSPTSWYLEVASLLQSLLATLGMAYLLKIDGHLGLEIVLDRLKGRAKDRLLFVTYIFGLFCTIVIIIAMGYETYWAIVLQKVTENASILEWPFKVICTLAFVLLAIQFVLKAKEALRRFAGHA
jgi:TRAP-type C4-dicarboxylate transport system permease small subunit